MLPLGRGGEELGKKHTSGSILPKPPVPPPSCPRVAEPSSPHPPLPAGHYRFPFNNRFIIQDVGDGCPDIDIHKFDNNAAACPKKWRLGCSLSGGDHNPLFCNC